MFFGILLLAIGLAILLNALGVFSYSAWGIFWGIFFIAIGIRLMIRKGRCPVCGWRHWEAKLHDKMHAKMHSGSEPCCDHEHEHQEDSQG